MKMSLLEEFICVAKYQNISRAAKELYMSQSGLSEHINSLEKTLGFVLFDHMSNKVELTPAGEIFLEYAQRTLDVFAEGKEKAIKASQQMPPIKIKSFPPGSPHISTLSSIKDFPCEFIDVGIELTDLDALEQGIVDFAIACDYSLTPNTLEKGSWDDFEFIPFSEELCYFCLGPKSPFAHEDALSREALKSETILIPTNAYFDLWKDIVQMVIGKETQLKFCLNYTKGYNSLATLDLGTSLWVCPKTLYDAYCSHREDLVVFTELDGEKYFLPYSVVYKKDNPNKDVKKFAAYLAQYASTTKSLEVS